jgi:ABC-type nitrate/sulfonate/bicarbonate transport system substrate-binding protein
MAGTVAVGTCRAVFYAEASMRKAGLTKRLRIFLSLLLLVALIAGAYIFWLKNTDSVPAPGNEIITIACSSVTDTALVQIAYQKGYFLQEGLDAVLQLRTHGKAALEDMLAGRSDIATVAETPVMFSIMKGQQISIIATIQSSNKNNAIIARRDFGIQTLQDLRGRKVAVTLGTTADFFFHAYLAAHGISNIDIKTVNLKPENMPDAIANGDIDAVATFNPYISLIRNKLGAKAILFSDTDIHTQTFNLVATQEYIRNNPDKIRRLLEALKKAELYVNANPSDARQIIASSREIDADITNEIWFDSNYRLSLDQTLLLSLEDESRWAIKNRLAKTANVPNYLNFIYLDGLRSVNPKAVSILR